MERMEKLIELYNKHLQDRGLTHKCVEWEVKENINMLDQLKLFVKRLVENDKIDLGQKLFNLTKNDNRKSIICDLDNNDFSWEDTFLMLLSISDTPIEDLISYLR